MSRCRSSSSRALSGRLQPTSGFRLSRSATTLRRRPVLQVKSGSISASGGVSGTMWDEGTKETPDWVRLVGRSVILTLILIDAVLLILILGLNSYRNL